MVWETHVCKLALGALALSCLIVGAGVSPAAAQAAQKPNIVVIMGDDIGWMQPSIYHRGLMVGRNAQHRPHRQRRRNLHGLCRHAELHLGTQRLLHRHVSAAHGHDPAATARQPVLPASRNPGVWPVFLLDLGYTTGEFGKNHLGDHTASLPTAHGFQEFWGYLYHLDAMQQVSFPDINSSPTVQGIAPPCKNTPVPGLPDPPGALDPEDRDLPDAAASGDLVSLLRRHREEPDVQGRRAADAGAVENGGRGNLRQGHRLPRPQRPQEDRQALLRLVQPGAHARHHRAAGQVPGHGGYERAARTGASTKPA